MVKISYNKLSNTLLSRIESLRDTKIEKDDGTSYYDIMIMSNVEPAEIKDRINKNPLSKISTVVVMTNKKMSLSELYRYYESNAMCICGKDSTEETIYESIKSIISSMIYNYSYDTIVYNLTKHTSFIPSEGMVVSGGTTHHLNPKEASIFKMLCDNIGVYIPKKTFLYTIWGNASHGTDRSFDVYINRLRHIIEGDTDISIRKIRGTGYLLSGGEKDKNNKNRY